MSPTTTISCRRANIIKPAPTNPSMISTKSPFATTPTPTPYTRPHRHQSPVFSTSLGMPTKPRRNAYRSPIRPTGTTFARTRYRSRHSTNSITVHVRSKCNQSTYAAYVAHAAMNRHCNLLNILHLNHMLSSTDTEYLTKPHNYIALCLLTRHRLFVLCVTMPPTILDSFICPPFRCRQHNTAPFKQCCHKASTSYCLSHGPVEFSHTRHYPISSFNTPAVSPHPLPAICHLKR